MSLRHSNNNAIISPMELEASGSKEKEQSPPPVEQNGIAPEKKSVFGTAFGSLANNFQMYGNVVKSHKREVNFGLIVALLIAYHVYLIFAIMHNFKKASALFYVTLLIWGIYLLSKIIPIILSRTQSIQHRLSNLLHIKWVQIVLYAIILCAIVIFLIAESINNFSKLRGLCGVVFYVLLIFLCSNNKRKIKWRTVILGFSLHFFFAILILKWTWGAARLLDVSNFVVWFLDHTQNGTAFVFGFIATPPPICGMAPVFMFSALQTLIYFGAIVAVLYYWGIMQMILKKTAWFMRFTLGTTGTESLAACGNTILGMSEGPLLIRPYLERMTASELHAICTSGFSCIAGSMFSAYISFGACPNYLMAASILSAPGSLAFSKLLFPETEKSQLKEVKDLELEKPKETNAIECLSNGAASLVGMTFAIGANLVVFNALLALLDDVINYIGTLIGYNSWTFQGILGYIFFPLAYIMGVTSDTSETLRVAQLMGTKTAVNEFVAYKKLGEMISSGQLSPRAAMIATYSLCSFANFGSVGIQLELLGSIAPSKKPTLSRIMMQALLAGAVTSFYTAAIAGILVENPTLCLPKNAGDSCFNPADYINKTIG